MQGIEGTYFHVRVLIGMVVGLAIGNLLRGVARVISDEKHRPIYWVQMVWVLSMLGTILHFWWFEIRFDLLPSFTFPIFAFWVCYVLQLFFLTALLLPENVGEFENNREHFLTRRHWFFGFLALFYVLDFAESWLKGAAYIQALGPDVPRPDRPLRGGMPPRHLDEEPIVSRRLRGRGAGVPAPLAGADERVRLLRCHPTPSWTAPAGCAVAGGSASSSSSSLACSSRCSSSRGASGAEVSLVQQLAVVLAASLICQALRREPLPRLLGPLDLRWPREFLLGGLGGALLMAVPALFLGLSGVVSWRPGAGGAAALWAELVLLAAAAATEELLFRGFLFRRLLDGLGTWPAQFLIAALFVLTHSDGLRGLGPLAFLAGANIFLASILFGLAYLRTGSLAMPIGLHLAANVVQGPVLGFGVSGHEGASLLVAVPSGAPDWLSGGKFGLEASVPGLVCVVALLLVLRGWRRYRDAGPTRFL